LVSDNLCHLFCLQIRIVLAFSSVVLELWTDPHVDLSLLLAILLQVLLDFVSYATQSHMVVVVHPNLSLLLGSDPMGAYYASSHSADAILENKRPVPWQQLDQLEGFYQADPSMLLDWVPYSGAQSHVVVVDLNLGNAMDRAYHICPYDASSHSSDAILEDKRPVH
jgi:hypothetical protein